MVGGLAGARGAGYYGRGSLCIVWGGGSYAVTRGTASDGAWRGLRKHRHAKVECQSSCTQVDGGSIGAYADELHVHVIAASTRGYGGLGRVTSQWQALLVGRG